MNAVFYLLRTRCQRRFIPPCFPPWGTVCHCFRTWARTGVWTLLHRALYARVRTAAGRAVPGGGDHGRAVGGDDGAGRGVRLRRPQAGERPQAPHPGGHAWVADRQPGGARIRIRPAWRHEAPLLVKGRRGEETGPERSWATWLGADGVRPEAVRFRDIGGSLQAALDGDGDGVALARSLLVADALRRRQLVRLVRRGEARPCSKMQVARWRDPAGDQAASMAAWLVAAAEPGLASPVPGRGRRAAGHRRGWAGRGRAAPNETSPHLHRRSRWEAGIRAEQPDRS